MANFTLTDLLLFSAGAILVNYIIYIYIEFGLYELGRWQQPLQWPFFIDGEKERMTQKTSVNGSYNHGFAFASHSICFSKHACAIEILLTSFGSMSCAQQPLTRDSAICNSKKQSLLFSFKTHVFLPILFGVCAGIILYLSHSLFLSYLSIYLSVYLSVCLSVCLSVYLNANN